MSSLSEIGKSLIQSFARQCLPDEPAMAKMAKGVFIALLFLIVGSVLISALLILACAGLYQYLVMQGLPVVTSILLSGLMLTLFTAVTLLLTHIKFSSIAKLNEHLVSEETSSNSIDVEELLQAFIQGLLDEPASEKKVAREHYDFSTVDVTPNINKVTRH